MVIADFMLNRWGTWVHTGGLPFRLVRYENGTTEEWADGFAQFIPIIGLNATIANPPQAHMHIEMSSMPLLGDFAVCLYPKDWDPLTFFWNAVVSDANGLNHCLKYGPNDTDTSMLHVYAIELDSTLYVVSAALMVSNKTTEQIGVFVYSNPWQFADPADNHIATDNCGIAMGIIPTAAAIWSEVGYSAKKIVEAGATEARDKSLLQEATEAFNVGNYKQAILYAEKSAAAWQLSFVLPAMVSSASGITLITATILYRYRLRKKQET